MPKKSARNDHNKNVTAEIKCHCKPHKRDEFAQQYGKGGAKSLTWQGFADYYLQDKAIFVVVINFPNNIYRHACH